MARKATEPSLFLPGFGIDDDQAYPDLFTDIHSVTTTPLHTIAETVGPAPASRADLIATPRPWRPSTTQEANQALVAWPQWQSSALEHLDGQATKFTANLHAIAALRALEAADREPSSGEREALLRFTGWGGIPASFNLEGYWADRRARCHRGGRFSTSRLRRLTALRRTALLRRRRGVQWRDVADAPEPRLPPTS